MDLNEVNLIGRITSEIELKQTPNGSCVTNFSVATNKNYTDSEWIKQEQVQFHNIVIWWKLAEIITTYWSKGQKVFIKWELQTISWEAQDWTKRYKHQINASNIILLEKKREQDWITDSLNVTENQNWYKKNNRDAISIEDIPF